MGSGNLHMPDSDVAAAAVPGASGIGDDLSGRGRAGDTSYTVAKLGWAMPLSGGRDRGGAAGGGLIETGEAGMPDTAGGDYVGTTGNADRRILRDSEARLNGGAAGVIAAGRVTDSRRLEVWRSAGGGDGGDGSESDVGRTG